MANEHIGRKQAIGLGKEGTSGTGVAATVWIPKSAGSFAPRHEVAKDESAYGVIDGLREQQTVKDTTQVNVSAICRDGFMGHILTAAFGTPYACVKFPISGLSGTFVEGETVTETTSSATGTLRRQDQTATSGPCLYIVPISGTFVGAKTLTGGTSSATATGGVIESPAAVRHHVFRRLNSNAHPSYTLYGNDPIGDERAVYCMLNSLEIEAAVGDFCKFTANFMGKKLASTTTQAPTYTAQNPFLAKHASVKLAAGFTTLTAATAISVERFKIVIEKNLTSYQAFGDTDVASIHNQRFDIRGDMTLIYNAVTIRDYVANSTNMAMRFALANTGVTIGVAANPTLQFDIPIASFEEWSRTDDADALVKQTVSFVCEYDFTRAMQAEALLVNTDVTGYA